MPDHDVLFVILEDFGQDRERARVLELAQAISEFVSEEGRLAVKACGCGSASFPHERGPGYGGCLLTFGDDLDGTGASETLEREEGAESLRERDLVRVELAVETGVHVFVGRTHPPLLLGSLCKSEQSTADQEERRAKGGGATSADEKCSIESAQRRKRA